MATMHACCPFFQHHHNETDHTAIHRQTARQARRGPHGSQEEEEEEEEGEKGELLFAHHPG